MNAYRTANESIITMDISPERKNIILIMIHSNVAVYALCFWIQMGTLPYLTQKLNIDTLTFGYLQTTFAAVQLVGGPIFGRFGDRFGSKYAVLLALFSAYVCYTVLGMASTLSMVFLSRLPSIFMHVVHGGQMVITDISDARSRSAQLGKLSLSYGVGMVVGPILAGQIIKSAGEHTAISIAATGSAASFILILIFLPATKRPLQGAGNIGGQNQTSSSGVFNIKEIVRIGFNNRQTRTLLLIKSVSGIPIGVLHSMFSILALNYFKLSAEGNGYVLAYVGLAAMISQGCVVAKITKMGYRDWKIIQGSVLLICISFVLLLAIVSGVYSFCIALFPMVIAGAVVRTVMNGMLTSSVPPQDTGTVLGISMAANSLIRILGPTIGGFMLEKYGFTSFGILGIVCNAPLLLWIQRVA